MVIILFNRLYFMVLIGVLFTSPVCLNLTAWNLDLEIQNTFLHQGGIKRSMTFNTVSRDRKSTDCERKIRVALLHMNCSLPYPTTSADSSATHIHTLHLPASSDTLSHL